MMGAEIYDHDSKHPPLPGHKEHHCTDVPWLVLFIVALAGMIYTQEYAREHGNVRKLTHGFNYQKQLCGVDLPDQPYVYWCKDSSGSLALHYPICIPSCPVNDTGTPTSCFDPTTQQETRIPTYTTKHQGPFCIPQEAHLLKKLTDKLIGQGAATKAIKILTNISEARMLLAASACLAIVIGYIYLFLLDHYAGPVVKVALFAMIMGPIAGGAYFTYNGLFAPQDTASIMSDPQSDVIFGVCGFAIGGAFLIVACCFMGSLDTAVGCIEAACECLFQEPTLLLEPFISLTSKVITLVMMTGGILSLVSCGNVAPSGEVGIMRTFEWTDQEKGFMCFLVFMTFWLLEFGNAMSQYVLAWATQMWYFTPYEGDRKRDVPSCGICKGYVNVMTHHMGTIALGSLMIASLRVIRLIVMGLVRQMQAEGNCVGACIAKVCVCIITFFQDFLAFLNKNAYMDVAITSENFCSAASRAMGVMVEEGSVVAILNGAQAIFTITGMGLICGIPGFLTFVACKRLDTFSNPESLHYVETPKWVALASMMVCAIIGVSFMLVFDTVGDTILYCFAIDSRRQNVLTEAMSGAKQNYSDDEASEEDEGFFGWVFGGAEQAKHDIQAVGQAVFGEPVVYAPPRLRQLIADHEHLVN